jgi:hypothetical protein
MECHDDKERLVEVTASYAFTTALDQLDKRVIEAAGRQPDSSGAMLDGSARDLSWDVSESEVDAMEARLKALDGVTTYVENW